ncbi:MAG TPA: sulfurtransferase, partial [Archangium sp.]|nr:sulfurtransferase [Archangium sp.]
RYEERHLQGALHVDLDQDLASKPADPARGGRHPLPAPAAFAALLGRLGIGPETRVVVYDDKRGANAASRFWWMLKAAGHADVRVLDGGLEAALAAGVPAGTPGTPPAQRPAYPFERWLRPTADADEVARAARALGRLVIDVRDAVRYRGESEPIDPVPGHLPGAINVPFTSNLGPDGRFLPPEELARKYRAVLGAREPSEVIVHCGSGVTACHTLLALEHAGLMGSRLYVGSWSEWCRSGRPMVKGPSPGGEGT